MIEITKPKVTAFQYRDMREWCKENFGSEAWCPADMSQGDWYGYSGCDNLTPVRMMNWCGDAHFIFLQENYCTLFCLKWA